MNLVLFAVPVAPLVLVLVQIAKGVGFPKRYAPLLAAAIGISFGLVTFYVTRYPETADFVRYTLLGLLAGLAAAGLYDSVHETRKPTGAS